MGKPDRAYELEARSTDLDPFRGSPYRPAASDSAALKGLTEDCIRSHANRAKSYLHYGRQPQKALALHQEFGVNRLSFLAVESLLI